MEGPEDEKLTLWQQMGIRQVRRRAGRAPGEPLQPEDWAAQYAIAETRPMRAMRAFWRALPSSPRCGRCGAPFEGVGRLIVGRSATGPRARTRRSAPPASRPRLRVA
jgi:adenylate cyclase